MRAPGLFLMRVAHPDICLKSSCRRTQSTSRSTGGFCPSFDEHCQKRDRRIAAQTSEPGFQGKISVAVAVAGRVVSIDVIDNGMGFPRRTGKTP